MYEAYMQNLFGIQMNQPHGYTNPYYMYEANEFELNNMNYLDLESMYPEVYKIIYPMVTTTCMRNDRPVTNELINEMTREIYESIEERDVIDISGENRQRNGILEDLIKILLIRELIGRRKHRPGYGARAPRSIQNAPFSMQIPPMQI